MIVISKKILFFSIRCFKLNILNLISAICLVFFLLDWPDFYSTRSFKHAWDLGHIFLFFVWTYTLLRGWKRLEKEPFNKQLLWCFFSALLIGVLTEWAQMFVSHRVSALSDVRRDVIGSIFAVAFFSPARKAISKTPLRVLWISILLIISFETLPVIKALTDETIARKQFPLLAGFETPFEIERWESRSKLSISHKIILHGKASLKVTLTTAKYSGVSLKYFPRNWQNYRFLHFSVFNSSSDPLRVNVRVHDNQHIENGQSYYDRFNTSFTLSQGWNDIEIPIERIARAPKTRTMDLSHIKGVGIFVMNLKTPKVIYIDDVRLVK